MERVWHAVTFCRVSTHPSPGWALNVFFDQARAYVQEAPTSPLTAVVGRTPLRGRSRPSARTARLRRAVWPCWRRVTTRREKRGRAGRWVARERHHPEGPGSRDVDSVDQSLERSLRGPGCRRSPRSFGSSSLARQRELDALRSREDRTLALSRSEIARRCSPRSISRCLRESRCAPPRRKSPFRALIAPTRDRRSLRQRDRSRLVAGPTKS